MDTEEYVEFGNNRKEWLKERTTGIGGSDASIVFGVNPWKSRLELWHEKVTGNISEVETMDTKWGKLLEPLIVDEYTKITGRTIIRKHPQVMIRSKEYPFMTGNLDGEIVNEDLKPCAVLEVKTKGAFIDWGDEQIPIYYMTQLQHYLAVTGYNWGSFAILNLGKKNLEWFDVERDNEMIKLLIEEEKKFWDLVINKTPPDVDASEACNIFLRKKYSDTMESKVIDIKDNVNAYKWAMELKDVRTQLKILEESELGYKNKLMNVVGDAEKAIGNGFNITWKSPKEKILFDTERFKKEHPELYKDYTSMEKQTRRFYVRFEKDKKDKKELM